MLFKYKSLIYNILWKLLITRVFAPEGKSARKYALIFRGISVNTDKKIKIRFQFESCPNRNISSEDNDAYPSPQPPYSTCFQSTLNSRRPLSCPEPQSFKKPVPTGKHKKTARSRPIALLLAAHKNPVPDGTYGLFAVMLVWYSQLFATVSTTWSQYAATVLCRHSLTETVLVHSPSVVRLKCSFHFLSKILFVIIHALGCKITHFFLISKE